MTGYGTQNGDVLTRDAYERFQQLESLIKTYASNAATAKKKFNPTPLGLCAFSLTTFVLSMFNAGATIPVTYSHGAVMGCALFYGGLIQFIAGLLEYKIGNDIGALAFCSYGGFWMGLASLSISAFGFLDKTDTVSLNNSLGVLFLAWAIFSGSMTIATLRTHLVLVVLLFTVMVTFILLSASKFMNADANLQRAGGAVGILAAAIAWYAAFASLLKRGENSYFELPVYSLAPKSIPVVEAKFMSNTPV
ncbi:unnamed protein product [Rotaria sp. Silwood2]|nr:unnamed protein product [Rotaria sp. Silwood2]CAF4785225.1 unnamed protein product [Rotaria sp. Silwood2]